MTTQLNRNSLLVSIALAMLIPCAVFSQDVEPAPKHKQNNFSHLRVEVTAGEEAEAVSGADVFVKSDDEDTPFDRTLKTDNKGVVSFAKVPRVNILIQVTAAGCRTFGKHYELTDQSQTIAIRLERDARD